MVDREGMSMHSRDAEREEKLLYRKKQWMANGEVESREREREAEKRLG